MRRASPNLTAYLDSLINLDPTVTQPFVEDCFVVAPGNTQIAVNMLYFPNGGTITVTPPSLGNTSTVFIRDICVRNASDYSPVIWIPSGSPAVGQYTVNNSTGVYQFNSSDTSSKLITYVMGFGPFTPIPLFWTSGEGNLQFGSNTYSALGPFINRAQIRTSIGLNVDKVDLELAATPSMQLPSTTIPILQGFAQGYFDGATVLVHRMVMQTYGNTSMGGVVYFKGTVGEVQSVGRTHVKFEVRSRVEILNRPVPRNTFQPACQHVLFDSGCTLNRASFSATSTVQSGSNASQIVVSLSQPADAPGPAAAPALSICTPSHGVNLVERQEFAVVTYVSALGESLASPEANQALGGNQLLVVASPPSATGVTGWNCYIGTSPGEEMLQNATPIPIGTNWTEGVGAGVSCGSVTGSVGPIQGSPPPILATNGYFSQGVIWFTSGVNAGYSRGITTHTVVGSTPVLNLIPPLPNPPSPGDGFIVSGGCDKRYPTCVSKYNNLVHFLGFPWTPSPDSVL
jgi:hypothetical protein